MYRSSYCTHDCYNISSLNYCSCIFRLGESAGAGHSTQVPPTQPKLTEVEEKEDVDKEEKSGDTSSNCELSSASSDSSHSSADESLRVKKKQASHLKVRQFNDIIFFLILN